MLKFAELKFAADCLLNWFNARFKLNNLKLSNSAKRKYKIENPIERLCNHCCICPFSLEINATKFDADNKTMPYVNLSILRNISV